MLFGKRSSLPETTAKDLNLRPGNQRRHYRVRPGANEPVRASLERESGSPVEGDCIELSIGGAGVEFDASSAPVLEIGDSCSLRIRADSRLDAVKTIASVVAVMPLDDGGIRACFEFTNRIELYAQLDEFYARLFNRRRHVRHRADRETSTPVRLEWSGGSLSGIAHDVSEGGIGITMPLHNAQALPKRATVNLTFRLPRQRDEIRCVAVIRSRTAFAKECLVGIEFVPDGGIQDHLAAVRLHIEQRLSAVQAWNAGSLRRKAG